MGKYAKGISAVVAAILGVGVTALIPGISPELATSLTGLLTVLAVIFGPANTEPPASSQEPAEPTYLSN